MKKFIIALMLLIGGMGIMPAHAANWCWIAEDSTGNQWYIDTGSLVNENGKVRLWTKMEANDGDTLQQSEYHKDRTRTLLQAVTYDSNGRVVASHVYQPWELNTSSVAPGSIAEGIYDIISALYWERIL